MDTSDIVRCRGVKLTDEEIEWFASRMSETRSGRVTVPSHLITKFRKITGLDHVASYAIKRYLIDHCYNNN